LPIAQQSLLILQTYEKKLSKANFLLGKDGPEMVALPVAGRNVESSGYRPAENGTPGQPEG
jgi:hypothetical protein